MRPRKHADGQVAMRQHSQSNTRVDKGHRRIKRLLSGLSPEVTDLAWPERTPSYIASSRRGLCCTLADPEGPPKVADPDKRRCVENVHLHGHRRTGREERRLYCVEPIAFLLPACRRYSTSTVDSERVGATDGTIVYEHPRNGFGRSEKVNVAQ